MATTPDFDSPRIQAARLAGSRSAFLSTIVSDADLVAQVPGYTDHRAWTMIDPDTGLIDWSTTPYPGDVSEYPRAAAVLGGAA